jgi:hypothetical protein
MRMFLAFASLSLMFLAGASSNAVHVSAQSAATPAAYFAKCDDPSHGQYGWRGFAYPTAVDPNAQANAQHDVALHNKTRPGHQAYLGTR